MAEMTIAEQNKIIVDHEKAQSYGTKYLARLNRELFERGLILTAAMNKFNKFLDLPEGDSRAGHVWDLAFTILSTAVPALRLTKFISDMKTSSETALALAKRVQENVKAADAAKYLAARGAQGAGKIAQKIDDAKDKIGKIKDAHEGATKEAGTGENQLSKLDAARGPIRTLIADGRSAESAWSKALDAELTEFENRLGSAKSKEGSLENYIRELLPPVPDLTDDEMTEIEMRYLWEMIGHHVKNNVVITESYNVMDGQQIGVTTEKIEGLNNTQWGTILSLFGPGVRRGKIFFVPPIPPIEGYMWIYLQRIGGVGRVSKPRKIAPHGRMR